MNINRMGNGFPSFTSQPIMEDGLEAGKKKQIENRVKKEQGLEKGLEKKVQTEEKNLKIKENFSDSKVTFSKDGDILELRESSVSKYKSEIKDKDAVDKDKEGHREIKVLTEDKKSEEMKMRLKEAELKREEFREDAKLMEEKERARAELLKLSPEEEDAGEENISISFAGKSESDIAKLYLKGDISKAEYDQEIENRENERKATMQKDEKFMKEVLHGASETEEMAKFGKELKLAFSDKASRKFSPTDRFMAIEAAMGESKKEERKEVKIAVS